MRINARIAAVVFSLAVPASAQRGVRVAQPGTPGFGARAAGPARLADVDFSLPASPDYSGPSFIEPSDGPRITAFLEDSPSDSPSASVYGEFAPQAEAPEIPQPNGQDSSPSPRSETPLASSRSDEASVSEAGVSFDNSRAKSGEAPEPVPAETPRYRPPVEWWTIGEKRYESTQELLAGGIAVLGPVPAEYHYRPAAGSPGVRHHLATILGGAGGGAVLGYAAGLALVTLTSMFTFLAVLDPSGATLSVAHILGAMGAVLVAYVAGDQYDAYPDKGNTLRGTLRRGPDGNGLFFDRPDGRVDLQAHAGAEVLAREPNNLVNEHGLIGVVGMILLLLGSLVPVLNIVWPLLWSFWLSAGLLPGSHVHNLGGTLGVAALAYAVAAALWTGINVLSGEALFACLFLALAIPSIGSLFIGPWISSGWAYGDKLNWAKPWWDRIPEA